MAYTKKEIGSHLIYKNMVSVTHIRFIWRQLLDFIESEVNSVDTSKYRDEQYLKLIKLKIAKELIRFRTFINTDNVTSLFHLYRVGKLSTIFAEYVYFYDVKGRKLPRRDLKI